MRVRVRVRVRVRKRVRVRIRVTGGAAHREEEWRRSVAVEDKEYGQG